MSDDSIQPDQVEGPDLAGAPSDMPAPSRPVRTPAAQPSAPAGTPRAGNEQVANRPERPGVAKQAASMGVHAAAKAAGVDKLISDNSDGSIEGDVKDIGEKIAQGAAAGTKLGGGGVGTAVGAVVGAGSALVHNRRARGVVVGLVVLGLILAALPLLLLTSSSANSSTTAAITADSQNAATESGFVDVDLTQMTGAVDGVLTPWQLLAGIRWVQGGASTNADTTNPYGIKLDELNKRAEVGFFALADADLAKPDIAGRALALIFNADLNAARQLNTDADLLAGAVLGTKPDGSQGLYLDNSNQDAIDRYTSMQTAYLAAIDKLPIETVPDRDQEIFNAAHNLALGDKLLLGCGVNSGITAAAGSWVQPTIDADGKIGSGFGMRMHPILHILRPHNGSDLGNSAGTPIFAASSGKVTYVGHSSDAGWNIKIDHGNGIATRYLHINARADILVSTGDEVKVGQHIARMGNAGLSTSPHLHFEVHDHGTPVDPEKFYKAMGMDLAAAPTVTGSGDDVWATPAGSSGTAASTEGVTLASASTVKYTGPTTFKGKDGTAITFNETMVTNAITIATTIGALAVDGVTLAESDRERLFEMAVMTGIQESWMGTAKNMNAGLDVGIFQERSKVGWYADETTVEGNKAKLQDVAFQTTNLVTGHDVKVTAAGGNPVGYHIPGLVDQKDWQTNDLWEVIADTQRPAAAYRQQYDRWEPVAQSLLASFKGLLGSSGQGCAAGDLTVVQANIAYTVSDADFKTDLQTILQTSPDVITLNETGHARTPTLRKYAADNGYQLYVAEEGSNNILIRATLGTVAASGTIKVAGKMGGIPGKKTNNERAISWVTVSLGTANLTVIGTHTLPFIEEHGKPVGPERRKEATYKLIQRLADLAEEKSKIGMVISTGDMNIDYRWDSKVQFAKFPYAVMEHHGSGEGLTSIYTVAGGADEGSTIGKKKVIDYVYGWQAADSPLTNTGYSIERNTKSDHNFVVATYSTGQSVDGADGTWGDIIAFATSLKGKYRYAWGGGGLNGPTAGDEGFAGFDCSSFVRYVVYQGTNKELELPRTSRAQAAWAQDKGYVIRTHSINQIRAGDLVFYAHSSGSGTIYHVALAIGNGQIVEEPGRHRSVQINTLKSRMPGDLWGVARFDPAELINN